MADSIKVQVMQKIEQVLGAIPEIGSVNRWEGRPIDLDTLKMPAMFLFEEEEIRDKRNRLAMGIVKLHLMIFIPLTPAGQLSFHDVADNIQAKIHDALLNTQELKGLVENLQEGIFRKEFPNDLYGVLHQSFDITYCHVWGNAFSVAY
ncbi:MAG: hypothetical protein JRI66_11210 [Deltaproteobacteria bacterium]|nr:hypothetical protein [Deltaproteobacteria bacterium]